MQSNGGLMSARRATEAPVHILESGPAAGVVAADEMGKRIGLERIIAFDMGGTTAKASLIENGQRSWTTEYEVGAGISLSSRLVKGGGYAVKVPVMDLAEVGAGGGSIVWIDRGGALRVGPQSAGAVPGPVCYDFGGKDPTVTDANLVLGYINPVQLAGGSVDLRGDMAVESLQVNVADRLGLSLLEAAYGVHTVANVSMIRAIRAVSTYRGRDPREFALLAFGGSGPIHAVGIARSLDISHVVIPPSPGVFSAIGLLEAQPEHHFVQTFVRRIDEVDTTEINEAYARIQERGTETLKSEGYVPTDITWERLADLRYVGQAYELTVPAAADYLRAEDIADLDRTFQLEHERTYGYRPNDEPVELVNLRISARAKSDQRSPNSPHGPDGTSNAGSREAYFGGEYGMFETPIVARTDIGADAMRGPFIIEEYDATVVVPPECIARLDKWNNVVIEDQLR
jgi:N-methylhydantoinase A